MRPLFTACATTAPCTPPPLPPVRHRQALPPPPVLCHYPIAGRQLRPCPCWHNPAPEEAHPTMKTSLLAAAMLALLFWMAAEPEQQACLLSEAAEPPLWLPPHIYNPCAASWQHAPPEFEDPKLGFMRASPKVCIAASPGMHLGWPTLPQSALWRGVAGLLDCHLPPHPPVHAPPADDMGRMAGLELLHVSMQPCTAVAPRYHPHCDESVYVLEGAGRRGACSVGVACRCDRDVTASPDHPPSAPLACRRGRALQRHPKRQPAPPPPACWRPSSRAAGCVLLEGCRAAAGTAQAAWLYTVQSCPMPAPGCPQARCTRCTTWAVRQPPPWSCSATPVPAGCAPRPACCRCQKTWCKVCVWVAGGVCACGAGVEGAMLPGFTVCMQRSVRPLCTPQASCRRQGLVPCSRPPLPHQSRSMPSPASAPSAAQRRLPMSMLPAPPHRADRKRPHISLGGTTTMPPAWQAPPFSRGLPTAPSRASLPRSCRGWRP